MDLIYKLPWPGDGIGTLRSSCKATACPHSYHKQQCFTLSLFIAQRQAKKFCITIFSSFDLTRPGIESESAVFLTNRALISFVDMKFKKEKKSY